MNKNNSKNLEKIFEFLHVVEDLKSTLRYNSTKKGRRESTAEHSWRLTLMSFIILDELKLDLDKNKVMKLCLIHDLPEALVGDVDAIEIYKGTISKEEKSDKELNAMIKIKNLLPNKIGEDILNLWKEYENSASREAKFVKALDKIETTTQLVEIGHTKWHYPDFVAQYSDKTIKDFPELLDTLKILKQKLKAEFKKGNLKWKKEYDIE